jgi:hypothetical protein
MIQYPKVREEKIKFWLCLYFSTNRAHALDLYLLSVSITHFEECVGESIPQILQVEVSN